MSRRLKKVDGITRKLSPPATGTSDIEEQYPRRMIDIYKHRLRIHARCCTESDLLAISPEADAKVELRPLYDPWHSNGKA